MKNIFLLFIVALMIPCGGQAQKSVRKFYQNVKRGGDNVKVTLPGFLIHMGAGIGKNHLSDDDPNAALGLEMTKYIKKIKIVVAQDQQTISKADYNRFVDIARRKDKFEDLLLVKDGETNVNIMMRGNERKIKNLLILVNDGDEFVMMSMKTNLKYKHLNKFLGEILKNNKKIKITTPKETKKSVKETIERV